MVKTILAAAVALTTFPLILILMVAVDPVPPAQANSDGGLSGSPTALARLDIPPDYLAWYTSAAQTCPGLPWAVLAGIGKIESDHGRSDAAGVHSGANSADAEGPMQFLPATFAAHAVNADPSQPLSPYD